MGFLGNLAHQISSQYSLGENQNNTLDSFVDGSYVKYGSLGDVAKTIDQSAERKYVEQGYLRNDPFTTTPKQFEILMQEPSATILIKKRMFSSMAQNYRPDYMDKEEALYFKATKLLFANKCRQIAAMEKLSKIEKIASIAGQIDNALMPLIFTLTDISNFGIDGSSSGPFSKDLSNFTQTINTLRRLYAFNQPSKYTTWLTDISSLLQTQFGQGTGVIELTNVSSFTTNVGLNLGSGNASFTIADPYELMNISEYDIECAIADATNGIYNTKIFQLGKENADQLINDLQVKLNYYRSARKASPITFKINPDTLLGRRVSAIIDRIGIDIRFTNSSPTAVSIISGGAFGSDIYVAPEYLKDGAVAGLDGLDSQKKKFSDIKGVSKHTGSDSELSIFKQLIKTIFSKLSLMANSVNAFQMANKNTNYARRKMRFNFLGKLMIQPMDVVHVYVSSKSRYDNRLMTGINNMFTGMGFLQNLNNSLTNFANSWDNLFNPSESVNLQAEKCAIVGPNFPNFLWSVVRGQFVPEKEGVHTFGGLVDNARSSYSGGKNSVSVSCSDQSKYFDLGKINFNPGVDVFNGSMYDPLTPFKTNFDSVVSNAKETIPVLLDENKWLLTDDGRSSLVKHKSGPTIGEPVTENSIIQDQKVSPTSGILTKTFYAPDGLVYRWKEGIGVFVQFGEASQLNGADSVGSPNIFENPFAGQDVMNVLSLLITGRPYNFMTYWKTTVETTGVNKDTMSQQDIAHTFMESLRASLAKNNSLWGNFIPFKNLMVDDQTFSQKLRGQFDIVKQNADLNEKLKKLQDVQNKILIYGIPTNNDSISFSNVSPEYQKQMVIKEQLQKDIEAQISKLEESNESYYSMVGDDVTIDSGAFLQEIGKDKNNVTNPKIRRLLRRQINSLTRRMSYNVRANDDKNLFIVDDFYDKDYDIAAYNLGLSGGLKLYNNTFTSVKENISNTAGLLNLEIFCDTQGHLRTRPSQYNRMPSSVFYKMMFLKKSTGVQVFPQFLEDLFSSNINTLVQRIEVIEDQIRLNCAALGYNDDINAVWFFGSNVKGQGEEFGFISNEDTGSISDVSVLMKLANIDSQDGLNGDASQLVSSLNKQNIANEDIITYANVKQQASSSKKTFNSAYRAKKVLDAITNEKLAIGGYGIYNVGAFSENQRVIDLINRIQTKTGQIISKDKFIKTNTGLQTVYLDVFAVTDEITTYVEERQKAIKSLYSAMKNVSAFKSLDDNPNTSNLLQMPGNYGHSEIPEVFEHMLEDESYDDLGPGSGSRYIIRRPQILSMDFTETDPRYTCVEVRGVMNPYAPTALPSGLNSFPQGGNAMVTAMAVDYDMWRNYGFTQPTPVDVPFFENPNTQCAPYATMLLSRARKEVLQGSITISGNEYMQPGEVVFLEDRGLLYYVDSVSHSFNYGSSFKTTLSLKYGHVPGEYIPTPLDVVGKMIFNNRDNASIVVQRQSNCNNENNMGIVQRDKSNPTVISTDNNLSNYYSNDNSVTINNILFSASHFINTNGSSGNNVKAKVQLRIYYDDNNPVDYDLEKFANSTREILLGKLNADSSNNSSKTTNVNITPSLNKDNIDPVIAVNLHDTTDSRSPSQPALAAARMRIKDVSLSDGGSSSSSNNTGYSSGEDDTNNSNSMSRAKKEKDKLRAAIFKYIVDCWIIVEQVDA